MSERPACGETWRELPQGGLVRVSCPPGACDSQVCLQSNRNAARAAARRAAREGRD